MPDENRKHSLSLQGHHRTQSLFHGEAPLIDQGIATY
jgi:hypothetical protein